MFTFPLDQKSRIQSICSHTTSKINPIFEQVLIEADACANMIRFSASNGSQFNSFKLEAMVSESCSFTLSAKRLATVLSALAADTAKFELKNGMVIIKSGKSRLKSPASPASDYPDAPTMIESQASITCNISELSALFNTAAYAVAKGDVRTYLCHVNVSIEAQTVKVCATDGHRLSQLTHENLTCSGNGSYLVPTSLISAVLAQSLPPETQVVISFDEQRALITSSDTSVISVLGEGRYPDVNRVIPNRTGGFVSFNLDDLKQTIKRFHAVASLEKNPILRFDIDKEVVLSVSSIDETNSFAETIDHVELHCPALTVGVNPSYLADALAKQGGDTVTFYFNQSTAILITCDIHELITLVMPVRC